MTALHRKLWRDLLHLKTQTLAISLVIGCGVATFVMSLSTHRSLQTAQDSYYERQRFAHVFAHVKRAPRSMADRLAEIPGVARVQTRVVVDVTLDIEDMIEPAVGRLISLPEHREPSLNTLHLRRGRFIEPGRKGEVLANEAFAEAHGFQPGDTLKAVINGKLETLRIVGIALSPEYIYQIRAGDIFPDDRRFGVLWMGETDLAAAFDLTEAFNDISMTLMRGTLEGDVLQRVDDLTEPYGGQGAHTRSDQVSHRYVSDELTQLRAMALIPPTIFLLVAAFILNVVLNRLIQTQREQIAVIKAFGYSRWEVGRHYLTVALLIVVVGDLLGVAAGAWLGRNLTQLYAQFFRFPEVEFRLDPAVLLLAVGISGFAALLGVMGAVRRAIRLPPAEAMRPEPPLRYRPTLVERLGLQRLFSQGARMILRELERKPVRALLSSLGIALAVAVLILGSYSKDLVDFITEFQFYLSRRYDFTVSFVEPASAEARQELANLPGVLRYEPFRQVAVRLRFDHRSRRLGIMGLPRERRLFRLMDWNLRDVELPHEGLVISKKLAELLGVGVGDRVIAEVLEGERPTRALQVSGLLEDFTGLSAYMDLEALNRWLREGATISGAFLACDATRTTALYTRLKETPRVAAVSSQRAALLSFQDTMSENMLRMRMFNIIFASIIAFGVVYNSARIALSERSRELASLRVLGFTRTEISAILLGEIGTLTVAAIPLGLLLGYGVATLATAALETETQRFPLVIAPATYAFAVTVILLASILSSLVVRRRLDHLDLVAVLKSRD